MVLNYLWIIFFLTAFVIASFRLIFEGDGNIFADLVSSIFEMSELGFRISIGLTGVLAFWLGIMRVGEKGGIINLFSKAIYPLFRHLFPELPKDHPAVGAILMNIAANMLGLDNAATPMGLKAMQEMQKSNKNKETASNAQIMFLVLNTSGLTLIPVSIMVYRANLNAANPSDIFLPILIATYCSTIAGLIIVSFYQKINLLNPTVILYLGGLTLFIGGITWYFSTLPQSQLAFISKVAGNAILFTIIILFIIPAVVKKINVYETFVKGAKEGFGIAVKIIPYLIAILVAVGVFRTSGAMDFLISGIKKIVDLMNLDNRFVEGLPTALMKPLSGSGARGIMVETMKVSGADSFAGRLVSVLQGSTDTTFYVLAVYFGSVGIKKTRHALICGLFADFVGIIAAISITYLFFG